MKINDFLNKRLTHFYVRTVANFQLGTSSHVIGIFTDGEITSMSCGYFPEWG